MTDPIVVEDLGEAEDDEAEAGEPVDVGAFMGDRPDEPEETPDPDLG